MVDDCEWHIDEKLTVVRLMDDTLMRYDEADEKALVWFEFLCYGSGLVVEKDAVCGQKDVGVGL
jgi:hypothetical protein